MAAEAEAGPRAPMLLTGLLLGLLSTLGPLGIDLYLPAFPTIQADLGASAAEVQRSLSAFFLALAAAQIPWGSLGDRFGRKPPLYAGLAIFCLASIGCALARDPLTLTVLRFVEGFGICASTGMSRAMIRDLYTGHRAARLLALSYLVMGVSPMLAPLAGSLLLKTTGWRGLFWLLAAIGAGVGSLAAAILPESLPPARRRPIHPAALLSTYAGLLGNPRFIATATVAGLATATPYGFLTAAPFLFAGVYHLSPTGYSLLLGLAAACSIATTQVSPNLMRRFGARRLLQATTAVGLAVAAVLAVLAWTGLLPLPLFQILIMGLFALVGLTLTPAAISALDAAEAAGAAAALLGTLQLVVTSLASAALTLFPAQSVTPLASLLCVTWLASSVGVAIAFARRRPLR